MADTELPVEAVKVLAGSLVGRLRSLHPVFTGKASGMCWNVPCANRVVCGKLVSAVGNFFLKRKKCKPKKQQNQQLNPTITGFRNKTK